MSKVPPSYGDLGKAARDVFNKGFGFGLVKLDTKTKTTNGVEFSVNGTSNVDSGKTTANLETKYKWPEYGLTFVEKWHTDTTLNTEITIEDQLAKGLKLTFDTAYTPNTGKKSGKVKSAYKMDHFHSNVDVDFDFAGQTIHGAFVLAHEGWLAGYQVAFDTAKSKLLQNNFTLGYQADDFELHAFVKDTTNFGGSIFHKVNPNLDAGVQLNWVQNTNNTIFAIGAKYKIDKDSHFNAKVNNSSEIGLGFTNTIRPGVKLTLSTQIDAKRLNQGAHKLGLGIDMEA